MREQVLRDQPICAYCGERPSTEVDHVIPLGEGGTSDRLNLRGACKPCHSRKTSEEAARAKARAAR